jgi:hypothetical protein
MKHMKHSLFRKDRTDREFSVNRNPEIEIRSLMSADGKYYISVLIALLYRS